MGDGVREIDEPGNDDRTVGVGEDEVVVVDSMGRGTVGRTIAAADVVAAIGTGEGDEMVAGDRGISGCDVKSMNAVTDTADSTDD